jgi:deoxyribonuclease I
MLGFILALLSSLSVYAINPNQTLPQGKLAYYGEDFNQAQTKNLKESLFNILNNSHLFRRNQPDVITNCQNQSNCYRHRPMDYSQARETIFGTLHIEEDEKGTFVEDVYCNRKVYFRDVRQISRMHDDINIEHTWPQSRFSSQFNKEMQKTDLHHLFPTDSFANNVRANHPFGESVSMSSARKLCSQSQIQSSGSDTIFTPPRDHRGNVARAIFYFSIKYKLAIDSSEENTLRRWHREDPVDEDERVRHAKIAEIQRTRNPFIDYPELVGKIQDF